MEARAREGDLLGRFRCSVDDAAEAGGGDSEKIELELSLGGCFSSEDRGSKRLVRSTSILALLPHEAVPLERACSLPSEVEEELRRKREVQSLRRMVGMRKVEEKRNLKRAWQFVDEGLEGDSADKITTVQLENSDGAPSPGLPRWVEGAAGMLLSSKALPPSQGSIVSQGSSSSGGTELESRPWQGIEFSVFSSGSEFWSPSKVLNISEHNAYVSSSATPTAKPTNDFPLRKSGGTGSNGGELRRNMMEEMPSVSTKCDGPNGRRIEGFLYKYRRGEEVRIVCVCHGSFLTPAEFVKHAGWGDVAHPLRHIVVNPRPAAFL